MTIFSSILYKKNQASPNGIQHGRLIRLSMTYFKAFFSKGCKIYGFCHRNGFSIDDSCRWLFLRPIKQNWAVKFNFMIKFFLLWSFALTRRLQRSIPVRYGNQIYKIRIQRSITQYAKVVHLGSILNEHRRIKDRYMHNLSENVNSTSN